MSAASITPKILPGIALAQSAHSLLGASFRLGGSDPQTGVDCIGLVVAALRKMGREVSPIPAHSLRNTSINRFLALASQAGLQKVHGPILTGDIIMLRPSATQHHLAIQADAHSVIHAHAGLRRIVLSPAPLPWPKIGQWRLDPAGDMQWPQ